MERKDISLIITGGLRVPADFVKAMALGLDAIATQKEHLRKKLIVDESAGRLEIFFKCIGRVNESIKPGL